MTLKNWKAKRAGAYITVEGFDSITGSETKLVGVAEMVALPGRIIATDKYGGEHHLLV